PVAAADEPVATSATLAGTLVVARADGDQDGWYVALEQDGATIELDARTSVDALATAAHGAAATVEVVLPAEVVGELEDADLEVSDVDGVDLSPAAAEVLTEGPALT